MHYTDSDIGRMLQIFDDTEDLPIASVVEPVTSLGLPNIASVMPGQCDDDVKVYLRAWMKTRKRSAMAAALVYAGQLGSTAPKQDDYFTADLYRKAYSQWRDRCTHLQNLMLIAARKRKLEKRRAEERAEYAQKVRDERGVAVREYVTGLTPEDRAERRRQKNAEKAKRYRARQKAKVGKSTTDA